MKSGCGGTGNNGPKPRMYLRTPAATALFRYSVASNTFRTVSCHDADDQSTGDGDENTVDTQMVAHRRNHRRTPSTKVKQVREQPDQAQHRKGDKRAERADSHRQRGDRKSPWRCREISQLFVKVSTPRISSIARWICLVDAAHLFFPILSWTNSPFVSRVGESRHFPAGR